MFPDELRVRSFPHRLPHYASTAALSAHTDFVGSRVYASSGVTCHLHFGQNDRGLLRATAVTRGWNKSQHIKLTLEKKILPPLLPGFELTTFRSRARRSGMLICASSHLLDVFPNAFLETLPMLARLTITVSRRFKQDGEPLPFPTPSSSRRSMA